MKLRRFNEQGIEKFQSYLVQLKNEPTLAPPYFLLESDQDSETVEPPAVVENRSFSNRLEVGEYHATLFKDYDFEKVSRDAGLWTWLTLFYFEQVCPADSSGKRKRREPIRYIAAVSDFQKYYRHYLLGPFVTYHAHRDWLDEARCIMISEPHIVNDIVEQLASRSGRITNRAVVGLATSLYVTADGTGYKKGARGKGPGSPRRLTTFLDQLDLTYDLFGTTKEELLGLLPPEFDRFRH